MVLFRWGLAVLTIYFLADPPRLQRGAVLLFPRAHGLERIRLLTFWLPVPFGLGALRYLEREQPCESWHRPGPGRPSEMGTFGPGLVALPG
jgi:hypothetical protein